MTVIKTPQANYCGLQYFGLVEVFDLGNCTVDTSDDNYFLAWTASKDGITWKFWKQATHTSTCDFDADPSTNWTRKPKEAQRIIYRDGFRSDGTDPNTFWHTAGFYSDPAFSGDGYWYTLFGYTPSVGVWPLSVRFQMCTTQQSGFCGNPQIYCGASGAGPCITGNAYNSFSGMIPKTFDVASNQFIPNVADPHEWKVMTKSNGSFSHLLLLYDAGTTFNSGRLALRTSTSRKFPFIWSPERDYEVCQLYDDGYGSCQASGVWFTGVAAPAHYDAQSDPDQFYTYTATNKFPNWGPGNYPCSQPACTSVSSGAERVLAKYDSTAHLGEVTNLKITKNGSTCLHLTWNTATGAESYRIMEGHLSSLHGGLYDHKRTYCDLTEGGADIFPGKSGSSPGGYYYLVTAVCAAGSEGPPGYASSGAEIPVADGACLSDHQEPLCPP